MWVVGAGAAVDCWCWCCCWPPAAVVVVVEEEGCWEGCWEGKTEVACVSGAGCVVDWESLAVVVWVMVWESDCVVTEVELPGSGGPKRSMPADSRGWRDSSSFSGVNDRLGEGRGWRWVDGRG